MANPIIVVEKVVKRYDGRGPVLDEVSFSIEHGEFAVVYGKSGCGKTTLLNIIGGLDRPSSGHVVLDGCDLVSVPEEKLASIRLAKVGFVFQDYNLLADLTVRENVMLPLKISGKRDNERVGTLLDIFDLTSVANESANKISGGEAQRTAIARAMANGPMIILADEPTGNLDDENTARVIRMFELAREQLKTTVVLATHDKSIGGHATTRIFLENGKVRLNGQASGQ